MSYLHLTSIQNLKSILKHGIIPTPISIESHWESFKEDGLAKPECVYTWDANTYNNAKFVRDMIYTKWFIQPRNKLYDNTYNEIDFKRYGTKIYGSDTIFFLLEINNIESEFPDYYHVQEPEDDRVNTLHMMDGKYAHNDKPLRIFGKTIKPSYISVVERIDAKAYKNNTLGFKFRKYNEKSI